MDLAAFAEWMREELKRQNMTQADLVRGSGLSVAQISRIMNMRSEPSKDSLTAIAQGFKLPPELVYQKAAIFTASMPPDARIDPVATEMATLFLKLSSQDRDIILTLARYLYARQIK